MAPPVDPPTYTPMRSAATAAALSDAAVPMVFVHSNAPAVS
jgi:hypothetical protein